MITAPTPPTPPTPPARLESTSPRMIQIEPPSSPVPKVFSRIHEIREAQKQSQSEEYSEDYSEEFSESDEESSEDYSEEYIEEVPTVESVTNPEKSSEPIVRDRVQTHYRSEDGNFESTSSTEREPLQTNNRMPGQVQPYEVTEQVADARGKLIVEQFRKIEESREKQQSNQSQQTQTRVDIPRVNPSDYKSSTGTIIFTITAILVLVVVAFFTLRKSVLQKAKEKMSAESDNSTVENIPTEKNPVVNLSIKRAPIKKVETAFESKIESKPAESVEKKSVLQIKKNPIKKIDPVPIKTEPIQSEIPVDEVKSVDRDPDDKKIKGLNFEIRV